MNFKSSFILALSLTSGINLLFPSMALSSEMDPVEKLRTFFTSQNVRSQLDDQRNAGKFSANAQSQTSAPIFREPLKVKLQGVVLRENKKPVVFVNDGNTLSSRQVTKDIRVNNKHIKAPSYSVPVRVNQQPVTLKPGQQWNEDDRRVEDNFQTKPTKEKLEGVAEQVISDIID